MGGMGRGAKAGALVCVVGMVATWVAMTELLQGIEEHYKKPYLLCFVVHVGYAVCLPAWAVTHHAMKRTARSSIRPAHGEDTPLALPSAGGHDDAPSAHNPSHALLTKRFFLFAAFVSVVTFFGAYAWYVSLHYTIASANNAIYQSSSVFVFVLSVLLLGEVATLPKVLAVLVAVAGVCLVSFFHDKGDVHVNDSAFGYLMCVVSTAIYAFYEVVSKAFAPKPHSHVEELLNSFALLGLMGVFSLLLIWPGIFVVHATGYERFELPSRHVAWLLLCNVLLDTVFNFLLLFAIALTSPLFVSVGTMLVIPATIVTDMLAHNVKLNVPTAGGCVLIVLGFVLLHVKGEAAKLHGLLKSRSKPDV